MTKRFVVVAFLFALATTFVACTSSTDSGGAGCAISPTSPSCGGTTVPPAGGYEALGTWHHFVRADGSEDPYLEWALMEEPIPARGAAFIVSGCPNPCVTLRVSVRSSRIPGQNPGTHISVQVRTSINGESEADGSLGGFAVPYGETVEYYTSRLYYIANSYKWLLLKTNYGLATSSIPGTSLTQVTSTGRIFVDYGPKP